MTEHGGIKGGITDHGKSVLPGRFRPAYWLGVCAGALALLCMPMLAQAADSAAALEYKVKAGYLFNFARFIEWPAACLPASDSPFVIGIIDDSEALPVVRSLLEGKKVDGHPVQIKALNANQIGRDIHILLVTRAAGKSPEEIRTAMDGAFTLLVGETEDFAERGGMVGFTREEDRIRISLNLDRATEAGLRVSSKLSSVAKMVKTMKNK